MIFLPCVVATLVVSVVLIVRLDGERLHATLLGVVCVVLALLALFAASVITSSYFNADIRSVQKIGKLAPERDTGWVRS